MSIIVYCDVKSTFISQKIKKTINANNITFVIIFNQFHKSIEIIKKINCTLKVVINKIKQSNENMFNILKKITLTCNERYIEHFEYFFIQILHEINQILIFVRFLSVLIISKKIILFISKKNVVFDVKLHNQKKNVIKKSLNALFM